ncbi:inner membrane protein [Caballeronia udeis]|uniref:Inner membrane protein n=2 Tax=Caballeronia udeis TaxID=1232866 RepID=A0A158JWH1_9BURK|nr:inner membrane protein [Caballeronia udeis]
MYAIMTRRNSAAEDRALAQTLASARHSRVTPRNAATGTASQLSATQRTTLTEPGQRLFLAVPSGDLPKARALGAEWDREQRVCWIPASADRTPFSKWLLDGNALQTVGLNESEGLASFADAMEDYGLQRETPVADGKWHNVLLKGAKGQKKGAYILSLSPVPKGFIRNFLGREGSWHYDGIRLTPEQRAVLNAQERERAIAREREVEREHAAIAEKTEAILATLSESDASRHGYCTRKNVGAYGVRVARNAVHDIAGLLNLESFRSSKESFLVVPARDVDGKLWTVQAISDRSNGLKLFASGARKKGTFHIIGADGIAALCVCPAVLLVEGYATGASLFESTGLPVVVCFDAGNLVEVAKALRPRLPKSQAKIVCGDNDQFFIEKALAKIETVMPRGLAASTSVKVFAGNDSLQRDVSLAGYQPDGAWHQSPKGKYKLELETMQGVVRSVTAHVVANGRDNDIRLVQRNKGLESSTEAARAIGGIALLPSFESVVGSPTDFNDLANAEGRARVATFVASVLPFDLPARHVQP